jgi:uncharacterized membrane protein HdeD (DUF308 family)
MIFDLSTGLTSTVSIIGLVLSMVGTVFLVKPFILADSIITKLGSYNTYGAMLSKGKSVEKNEDLIKNFKDARDESFRGISYIFTGFSFQLIQYIPLREWYWIITEFFFILMLDLFIINRMKNRNKELRIK